MDERKHYPNAREALSLAYTSGKRQRKPEPPPTMAGLPGMLFDVFVVGAVVVLGLAYLLG